MKMDRWTARTGGDGDGPAPHGGSQPRGNPRVTWGLFKNTSVQAVFKTMESERGRREPQSLLDVYSSQEMLRDST